MRRATMMRLPLSLVSNSGVQKNPGKETTMEKITALECDVTTGEFVPHECEYEGPIGKEAWKSIASCFLKKNASARFYPLSPADAWQTAVKAAESAARKIAGGLVLRKGVRPSTYIIGAAKLALHDFIERQVNPARETYRTIEQRTMGKGAIGEDHFDADNHNAADGAHSKEMSEASDDDTGETPPPGTPSTAQALANALRGGTPMHIRAERALNRLSELCERILATDRRMGETIVLAFAAYIVADGNFAEACKLAHISKDRWYRDFPLWCKWARAAAREYGKEA